MSTRVRPRATCVLGLSLAGLGCTARPIMEDDATASHDDSTGFDTSDDGDPPVCGDGVARGTEVCDGLDLREVTCSSLGLGLGTPTCRFDCQELLTDDCAPPGCGNAIIEPGELCDGPNLGGLTCESFGLSSGTLACAPSCGSFDDSGCLLGTCGNGIRDEREVCDGLDLGGATCADLGIEGGQLMCQPDCLTFDVDGCGTGCVDEDLGAAVGPMVAMGNTNGDDDDLPQECAAEGGADHVLLFTPPIPGRYAIDTVGSDYDTALSVYGNCSPSSLLECNDDTEGTLESSVSVVLDADLPVLVSVDGFGGDAGSWVLNVTPPPIPPAPPCVEEDLGWATGSPVTAGDTTRGDHDLAQSCAFGEGPDHVIRFIAPATGLYAFDTIGSAYDTVLSIHEGCEPGDELVCNDEFEGPTAGIDIELTAGQSVLVVVGGFEGATGPWVLYVLRLR